jgi:hypothetical protein
MIIVSCYYNIPSKQPKEFYYRHISRFFRKLTWQQIVFFTDQENYTALSKLAGSNVKFIIQPFEESRIFITFPVEFWKDQIKFDPEKYHTWQLGALWASKVHFVKQVCDLIPSENWVIWVDAGSIRSEQWKLNNFTLRSQFIEPGVYLQEIEKIPTKAFFTYPDAYIAGSHILFHKKYISEFMLLYSYVMKLYIENKICVISDQNIMNKMTLINKDFIKPIYCEGAHVDKWFFFFDVI